jgi:hypothetical protein
MNRKHGGRKMADKNFAAKAELIRARGRGAVQRGDEGACATGRRRQSARALTQAAKGRRVLEMMDTIKYRAVLGDSCETRTARYAPWGIQWEAKS